MNKLVSKFNKKQFAVFVVTLICICLFTATTVYAAGDVSTAITSTWNAAKAQIKTVVNPCDSFLCENRYGIFRLQKTWSIRVYSTGYSFRLSNLYTYSSTLYLGHCWHVMEINDKYI